MAYKQVLLGDYFKFEKGLGYKGEFLAEESEVAMIGMDSHLDGGGYKDGSEKPYVGPYKPEHVAEVGDVIFAATEQGFGLLASPLMVPESENFQTFIFSHHVLKAFLKKDGFLPEYLYNIFRVERFRMKAAYGDTGTTVRALPSEVLEEQKVPLPDLPTQNAINEIISLIDQQIANNRSLSKNLELLAQSIFKSWFIDFDPVHAKSRGEKPIGMDEETAALFPDSFEESELGMIPKGWEVGTLADLMGLQGGYAFKSSSWQEEGVPVVKIGSVKPGYIDLNQVSYVSDSVASEISDVYRLPAGSILVGLTGYVGEVGLMHTHNPVPLLNQRVARFVNNNESVQMIYVYCITRDPAFKIQVEQLATGSAQQNVSISQILSIHTVIPSADLIGLFCNSHQSILNQLVALMDQNESLKLIRDSLLPRLISGELQMPEELLVS